MKFGTSLGILLLISSHVFAADDMVKVTVGTQTYHCELGAALSCKPINYIEKKIVYLKKTGDNVGVEDKDHHLSANAVVSLNGTNVVYDITVCSSQSCSINTVMSDATGSINQIVSGQYNVTQQSFDVLSFFMSTHPEGTDLQEKILFSKLLRPLR